MGGGGVISTAMSEPGSLSTQFLQYCSVVKSSLVLRHKEHICMLAPFGNDKTVRVTKALVLV